MASIFKRKDVQAFPSWRMQIRRKGLKTFCLSFDSEEEAKEWAKENEYKFLEDPFSYIRDKNEYSLINNRKREIMRSKGQNER